MYISTAIMGYNTTIKLWHYRGIFINMEIFPNLKFSKS